MKALYQVLERSGIPGYSQANMVSAFEVEDCEEWRELHRRAEGPRVNRREFLVCAVDDLSTLYEAFRKTEEIRIYREGGPSKADLLQHRQVIIKMLSRAEDLRIPLILEGLEDELFKIKTLCDSLQETLMLWHSEPIELSVKSAVQALFEQS